MKERQPMSKTVRSLRKGQITIPAEFRQQLGITDDTLLRLTLQDGELRIRPVEVRETQGGSSWLRQAYALFAPARQEALERGYTEEEINADIDEAIAAVREQHA